MTVREQMAAKLAMSLLQDSNGKEGYTFSINGKWGIGKTYFADKLSEKLKTDPHNCEVIKINLCNYDYLEDPLIPFIVEFINYIYKENDNLSNLSTDLREKIKNVILATGYIISIFDRSGAVKNAVDCLKELANPAKPEQKDHTKIDENLKTITAYSNYIEQLKSLFNLYKVNTTLKTIIFLIDDIDRTLPEFSYKILNLIHQIKCPNTIFGLIMNRKQFELQLAHTYGDFADGDEYYLDKFIDFEYTLYNPLSDNEHVGIFKKELGLPLVAGACQKVLSSLSVRQLVKLGKLMETLDPQSVQQENYFEALSWLAILHIKFYFQLKNIWYDLVPPREVQKTLEIIIGTIAPSHVPQLRTFFQKMLFTKSKINDDNFNNDDLLNFIKGRYKILMAY